MLEPHHGEIALPFDRVGRPRVEDGRTIGDLEVAPQVGRLRGLRLGALVVLDVDGDDPLRSVAEVEYERGVERPEAVEVRGIRRPGECAKRTSQTTGRIRPPGVDGPVGQREVGGEVAEEVEGERLRREEVGPQSLVVEALVRLDEDVRVLAASSAPAVRRFAPVSWA